MVENVAIPMREQKTARSLKTPGKTNYWEIGGYQSKTLQPYIDDGTLDPNEAQMIHLRYEQRLSAGQVANNLRVNRTSVRRLSTSGMRKLPKEVIRQLRQNYTNSPFALQGETLRG